MLERASALENIGKAPKVRERKRRGKKKKGGG